MGLTQVSTNGVKDGSLLNADVNGSAAIAGTKISPDFGSQAITTTGTLTINTNDLIVDSSGRMKIGTTNNTPAASNVAGIVFGDNTAGTATAGIASFCADGAAPLLLTRRVSDGNVLGIADDTTTLGFLKTESSDFMIKSTNTMRFQTGGNNERMRIDSSGQVGIGITSPTGKFHFQDGSANNNAHATFHASATSGTNNNGEVLKVISSRGTGNSNPIFNVLTNTSTSVFNVTGAGRVGIGTTSAGRTLDVNGIIRSDGTSSAFAIGGNSSTPSEGVAIHRPATHTMAFVTDSTERLRIDSSGNIVPADSLNVLSTLRTQGQTFVKLTGHSTSNFSVMVFGCNDGGHNTASTAVALGRHGSNHRSLNAAGTLNSGGNDYAEYMTKSGDFTIAKGDICGIDANGKLTNKFSESISFVVKSTDPSYVGGDGWGTEEILGAKPDDDSSDLPAYEEKLEAARKMVDRIAFCGQVPVNVTGATAGQYIIPTVGDGDSITGVAKTEKDLSMTEYMSSIGKVIALESDGRAKIIVKIA